MKILIIKTSSLGDIVHALPVVSDIRFHFPFAKIDFLVEEDFADLLRCHPVIDHVIPVFLRRWRKTWWQKKTWQELRSFIQGLRHQNYEMIIDLQGLIKSAFWCKCARGVTRCGQDRKTARERLASFAYDRKLSVSNQQHSVNKNRQLAALSLNYVCQNSPANYGLHPKNKFATHKPTVRYIMAFHASSRHEKMLPVSDWIALAEKLARLNIDLYLPHANEEEYQQAMTIAQSASNVVILDRMSLTELCHVSFTAIACIGVDTGLSHLAIAYNVPSVVIYGASSPERNGAVPNFNGQAINIGELGRFPSVEEIYDTFLNLDIDGVEL